MAKKLNQSAVSAAIKNFNASRQCHKCKGAKGNTKCKICSGAGNAW